VLPGLLRAPLGPPGSGDCQGVGPRRLRLRMSRFVGVAVLPARLVAMGAAIVWGRPVVVSGIVRGVPGRPARVVGIEVRVVGAMIVFVAVRLLLMTAFARLIVSVFLILLVSVIVIVFVVVGVVVIVIVIVIVGVGVGVTVAATVTVVLVSASAVVLVSVVIALSGRVQHVVEKLDRHPVDRRQRAGRGANPVSCCLDRRGRHPVSDKGHPLDGVGMDDLLGDGYG
jgi:hypothetical protein